MEVGFDHTFPAIRGVQAKREYYISMCPLRLIPKLFLFDEVELVPELRAQRSLNKARLPELTKYILDNRDDYVFSAITASIDAEVRFVPMVEGSKEIGLLHISMKGKIIINDGQHRRAAIEQALQEDPTLGDETIAVVFFLDFGMDRCQQMFADLNRHAVRPSKSLGLLYDHRDQTAILAKMVVFQLPLLRNVVDMERSALSQRSRKLFTLSAIHNANSELFQQLDLEEYTIDEYANQATTYWDEVTKQFPEWSQVYEGKITSGEVRRDYIHSHGIVLQALGRVGHVLLPLGARTWKRRLSKLKNLDWTRANAELWEGRAMLGGKVSKSHQNVTLTTNIIKQEMGLELTPEEKRTEAAFIQGGKEG